MDIKGFFDNIDHDLLIKAALRHTDFKWVLLYIKRWLVVPYQTEKGEMIERFKGVPQGSVIGPILANLFLHYAFDQWMARYYPHIPFERYADDTICHCRTKEEAEEMKEIIKERLAKCKLELNENKTSIVYCKDSNRKGSHEHIKFDFLGFTGYLSIDNNPVENAIRPVAIGRKNYLFAGSHKAAGRAAMVYSLFATCKVQNINPYTWLKDVLERLHLNNTGNAAKLLPQNWKKPEANIVTLSQPGTWVGRLLTQQLQSQPLQKL